MSIQIGITIIIHKKHDEGREQVRNKVGTHHGTAYGNSNSHDPTRLVSRAALSPSLRPSPLSPSLLPSRRRRRKNELQPRVRTAFRFRLDVDIKRLVRFQIERRSPRAVLPPLRAPLRLLVRILRGQVRLGIGARAASRRGRRSFGLVGSASLEQVVEEEHAEAEEEDPREYAYECDR
jgi:hypothetical protein